MHPRPLYLLLTTPLLLLASVIGCQRPPAQSAVAERSRSGASEHGRSVAQGACGTVRWLAGNQMPSPDHAAPAGQPVVREVVFYPLTNAAQVTPVARFYHALPAQPIRTVTSDAEGNFCAELPPGRYSVLTREPGKGLFANQFDGQMNISPVTVEAGRVTRLALVVDYAAAY